MVTRRTITIPDHGLPWINRSAVVKQATFWYLDVMCAGSNFPTANLGERGLFQN